MFLAKNLTQFPPQSLPLLAGKLGGSCFLCVFEKLLDTRFQTSQAAAVLLLMWVECDKALEEFMV